MSRLDEGKPDLKPATSTVVEAKPTGTPWYKNPWFQKFGLGLVGVVLGASCPLWPAPVQVICKSVAVFVQGAQ